MNLRLKILALLLIFGVFNSRAQERDSIYTPHYAGRLQIDLGIHHNFALGENFLGDAYRLKLGGEYGMDVFVSPNWLVGIRFDHIGSNLEKPEKLGNLESTRIRTIALNGGYVYEVLPQIDISLLAAIGRASYKHESFFHTKFHDSALVLWFQPKVGYRITNNLGIFAAGRLRKDFMNIDTSPELEDYFEQSTILTLSFGVRIATN
jgi:hypothetical protein